MPIALYPDIVKEQDLSPDHFGSDVDEVCEEILDATKGWGANKSKVIEALATKDATYRYKVALRYKELHGKDLVDVMRKEFSGDFGLVMELLALPSHMAECVMIYRATKGIGCASNVVWSIMCGRTNEELDLLKKTYFQMYTKDLGKLLASELGGNMERLVFNCMQAGEEAYDPQFHTAEKAMEDATSIREKGQESWGTDEKAIFKIICAAPPEHVKAISDAYVEQYGYSLAKAMEKELGGMLEKELQTATLHLIEMKLKPFEAMAKLIKLACAGFGTDERLLTCCLIRFQPVLTQVQTAHIDLFGKSIHDRVRSEAGGSYKDSLLAILNTVWPEG